VEYLDDDNRCLLYVTKERDNEIRLEKKIPLAENLQHEDFIPSWIHALDCLCLDRLFINTDHCMRAWGSTKCRLWEVEGLDDYVADQKQMRNPKSFPTYL
jgi:hypothetical protein